MAELNAKNLYDQLTPMSQLYYDQQFKKNYTPGKENILLSSQPEYNKMKAVYEAEQQVPEKSFLDSINIFGSASAAEPDKVKSTSGTPGFETIVNPDGRISIVPVDKSSNLPFNVGGRLFDQFNNTQNLNLSGIESQILSAPDRTLIPQIPNYFDFGMPSEGITSQVPDFKRFEGITAETDIDDDTQDEVENKKKSSGITDLLGFLIPGFNFLKNIDGKSYERFTPGSNIKDGIYSLGTFNQPVGMVNDFYDPISGTNRFDRAAARYRTTGSALDLFGSSRTGAEFFRKLRERKAAKEAAQKAAAQITQDVQDRADRGESLSDIGTAMFTGPGMAFEARNTGTGRGPK
jgi:hypothetical protein